MSPLSTVCLLTSYAVQSTLGDHDLDSCRPGYLASFAALRHHCKERELKFYKTLPITSFKIPSNFCKIGFLKWKVSTHQIRLDLNFKVPVPIGYGTGTYLDLIE